MTNEEFERAIDFLLKSQARFEAQLEQTKERQARTDEQLARTDEQLARTDEQLARTNEQLRQLAEQVGAFADTQTEIMSVMTRTLEAQAHINESLRAGIGELAARQSKTEEALTRLADAQTRTERGLGSLTKIVEEERGGR